MIDGVSRRGLLALAGGALAHTNPLTVIRAAAQVVSSELTDEQVREILFQEAEPGGGPVNRATIKPFWFQKPEGARPAPRWLPISRFSSLMRPISTLIYTTIFQKTD